MALGRPLRAAAFVFAVVICATSGCGLPDARPNLPPPQKPDSSDTFQWFRFAVPPSTAVPRSTAAAFLGFELYYRFAAVDSARARDLESRDDVRAAGFHRIARDDDRVTRINHPLIDRPAAGVVVQVDFGQVSEGSEPFVVFQDQDGNERRVRRAVPDDEGRYKAFTCDEFARGDTDIGSVVDQLAVDCGNSKVQLQAYAFSYGQTPDSRAVYSDAVDLGTIDLTFRNP